MLDSQLETFQNGRSVTEESPSSPGESLVGSVLAGRYRIERLLGSGGMGSVYRAEHVLMRKACAVKVLHREMTQVKEVVARFEREAVAAARIEHPNVAAATDFGQLENGSFYLVLEFIEGKSLSQLIAEARTLPEERALLIARQICEALAAAHASGIVHRDLKPDNVMLVTKDGSSDFVKVLDFGIAKVTLEESTTTQQALTRLNTVMGTPEYMAPEQARGEAVDQRADLYTVGAIVYEMLAGTSPFRHEEFVVVLTKKLTEDPPPLPEQVSQATRDLVLQLLQRSPADRPETAADVVAMIDGILGYSPAPATAFAPVSGQAARRTGTKSTPDTAYAATVLGESAVSVPGSISPVVRLKGALQPVVSTAVTLAKRRLSIGSRQVPFGLIFAALLALPVLLVLLFSRHAEPEHVRAAGQIMSAHVDADIQVLMQRAEAGDRTALAELLGRADQAKVAPPYAALGRGYFKIGQMDAGLRAYRSAGKLDAKLGGSTEVLADLRRALGDTGTAPLALEVAGVLGSGGADFLYDVYESNRTTNAALSKQAKTLLDSDDVKAQESPALKVALELPDAKKDGCVAVKQLMPRLQESADARSLPTLTRLNERRGCGFLGLRDCFACLRSGGGKDFAAVLKAASERPAPKIGG
jgi:serine/threonine-protein kinase